MTTVLDKGDVLQKHVDLRNLAKRKGPRLSDGTLFRDLFDFDRREVALRVMQDPEIHALEMERIFGRAWFIVGHESEIPNPGDFIVRPVGEDPVIVTRARDNSINVLLNACPHRGMEVCFADSGNTQTFKCPYHAWVFDMDGKLLGVPYEREMYGQGWDKTHYGLPRVHSTVRHGVIFANLADNPQSLEDYFGEMLWYFDQMFEGRDMMVIPSGTGRTLIPANWKTTLDQSQGDFLHTISSHHDMVEIGAFAQDFGQYTLKIHTPPTGHYFHILEPEFVTEGKEGVNMTSEKMEARKGLPVRDRSCSIQCHPTSILSNQPVALPDGKMFYVNSLMMHVVHGVDKFEFGGHRLTLVPKGTPPEYLKMLRSFNEQNSALGGIQFEDNETWRSITKAARGPATRKKTMKYAAIGGKPRKPEGWAGPGVVYDGFSMDDTQWHGWLHYFDVMTVDEG